MNFLKGRIVFFYIAVFFLPTGLGAQVTSIKLKSAPADLSVFLNGELQKPVSQSAGIRHYRINGTGILRFSAEGYKNIEYSTGGLPLVKDLLEVKLENEKGVLELLREYATGVQPKSAYFSPDGKRIFVPLLGQHGIDVFRVTQLHGKLSLAYERQLTVPGSNEPGFVEAMCDERRRELWVSNMMENKLHIFDLDTLSYKMSVSTGGVFPKVIVQNPSGTLTFASNWVTYDISVFDSDTKKLLRRIPVGGTPRGMAFSPDGNKLFVAIYDEPVIAVVDMQQNKVTTRYRLYAGEGAARHIIYNGGKLFVSDMFRGTVNIVDAATGKLLVSKRVGLNINTIALSPDGRRLFASSRGRNNSEDYTRPGPDFGAVYMLNTLDLSVEERVWGRNQPTGLAVSPNGKYLVFTDFLDANLEFYLIKQ